MRIFISLFILIVRNYCSSCVLPISLLLLDNSTYKHANKDAFELNSFVTNQLNYQYIEVDELSGLRVVKEAIEDADYAGRYVIYIKQSEIRKQENLKGIVEFCLYCRVLQ